MKTQKNVNCSIVERKYVILSYLILSPTRQRLGQTQV